MNIIEWLQAQELINLSQFTIDWVERVIDDYETRLEAGEIISWKDVVAATHYEIENVLAVLRPDLTTDVAFFNEALEIAAQHL